MISSFSIKFYLNTRIKNGKGESPIYLRVLKDRKKSEASINEYVLPEKWDAERQRVKEATKRDRHLNRTLAQIEEKIHDTRYEFESEKRPYTSRFVLDVLKGDQKSTRLTLLEYFDQCITEFSANEKEYGPPTILHYKRAKLMLDRFLRKEGLHNILLTSVSRKLILDFEQFILTTPNKKLGRCCNRNTTNKYLNKIKRVLGRAYSNEYISRHPFDGITLKEPKVNKIYLTEAEIETMMKHKLGGNKSLCLVRDFYIFCVYTGLRFSDASQLRKESIVKDAHGKLWISALQEKTDEFVGIPLIKKARRIYERYREHREETGLVIPSISNQKVNTYLKEIARICNIKKNITHNTSRHTFATTITLDQGISIKSVSSLLGHKSVKSTEAYIHISKFHLEQVAKKLEVAHK
jgi:integrase/recombinase XerD